MLVDDYKRLEESVGIKQLHFHLPNNDSFLRMHRVDRFGDNLTSVRESIRLANQQLKFTQGFEEGRIFNGFRYVFPLFYEANHIGSVELSVSFTALKQLLDQVFDNHFDFILKSEVVETKGHL